MRRLSSRALAVALAATSLTASGCCFCNNPFAVAALEDRETQLQAEVRDLERALNGRRKKTLPVLHDAMTSGSGFSSRGLPRAAAMTLSWTSVHGGVPLKGQLVSQGAVGPDAPASVRITKGRR